METDCINSVLRRAESQDIPRIIELVWQNVEEGPYKRQIVFNQTTLRAFVGALLADEQARVLVYEHEWIQGVFAFTTFPNFYYFAGQIVASMVVWSVAKKFRGRASIKLLKEGQKAAKELGAKYMLLTGPTASFDGLCEHCGYSFLESSFIKEL